MGFSSGTDIVDINLILDKVSELDIVAHYLQVSHVPCVINSPLRVDNHPSFGLWTKDGIKICYTDFATKEKGDIYNIFSKLWGISYSEVIYKIYSDLPKISKTTKLVKCAKIKTQKTKTYTSNIKLECKVREWRTYDLEYWETYGISKDWLIFGNIYPISHIFYTNKDGTIVISAEKYAYVYVENKDDRTTIKIYQPFSTKYKWMNNHDSSIWDLWTKLPEKGEDLIITSSRKDALCLWENTGIPSVTLQAESYLPKPQVIDHLKSRFTNIWILYDNDFQGEENYGRILGNNIATQFDLKQIEIPDIYKSKDTSDLCKNHSRSTVKDVILTLLNKK